MPPRRVGVRLARAFLGELQRGQQANDFFLADLEPASNAVTRESRQARLRDEILGWIPDLEVLVHVERLQRHRCDVILPSAEDPGGLRALESLATAGGNEVGARRDEPAEA